jgi:streptogramin lyase
LRQTRFVLILTLMVVQIVAMAGSPAEAGRRGTEFPVPTPSSYPEDITAGSDGNLWFTEYDGNKIGYVRPSSAAPASS